MTARLDPETLIEWDDDQLAELNVNKSDLLRLVRRLQLVSKQLTDMGLQIYVADGGWANIWHPSHPPHTENDGTDQTAVIAAVNGPFDGGGW